MPGYIEIVDSFQVKGWCLRAETSDPDQVTIHVNGEQVALVPCNLPRPDLRDRGLGGGYGGFCYLHPDRVDPQKVEVRKLSSGEPLSRAPDAMETPSPFRGSPVELIFASSPPSAPVPISSNDEGVSNVGGLQGVWKRLPLGGRKGGGERLSVKASVLVPPDAVLGVIPATDKKDCEINHLECTETPIDGIPQGAPNYKYISFELTVVAPIPRSYIALNLVELNQKSAVFGKNPISPVACMCVPTKYNWFTPIPDGENITRTCGAPNIPESFATSGLNIAYLLHAITNEFLGDRKSPTILDWGIGTGRVAVPLKRLLRPNARVLGVDVDRVNAKWCHENYPDIETAVSDFFPPLDFESSSIDMIYGISVMTHLTEGAQYAWLKELRRILKPGGLCVLTTHGEYALAKYPELGTRLVVEQLNLIGISDLILDQNLGPKLDMKKYYRGTFQTRKQVEEQWSRFLDVVAFYPAGLDAFQDVVVMRR